MEISRLVSDAHYKYFDITGFIRNSNSLASNNSFAVMYSLSMNVIVAAIK